MSDNRDEGRLDVRPRITINRSKNKDGHVQIFLNEAGRDLLARCLQKLSETDDHIHLGSPDLEPTELPLQNVAYMEGDEVLSWGKILFRPDKWDAEYYPHVLDGPDEEQEPPHSS